MSVTAIWTCSAPQSTGTTRWPRTTALSKRCGHRRSGLSCTTTPRRCPAGSSPRGNSPSNGWTSRRAASHWTLARVPVPSPHRWLTPPEPTALRRALGVPISDPTLARAVRAAAGPQVGFLRADAQRLPLRDETVDAAVSIAVLQLIPDPAAALSEIARVLKPGGRLAVMVPTLRPPVDVWRALPTGGAHIFGEDEVGDILEEHGFTGVRVKSVGTFQWVRGKRG